eukprot:14504-Heterococcus_DN1.PRE.2
MQHVHIGTLYPLALYWHQFNAMHWLLLLVVAEQHALQRDHTSIVYTQSISSAQNARAARQRSRGTAAIAAVLDTLITSVSRAAKPCCGIAMQHSQYAALSASYCTACARH